MSSHVSKHEVFYDGAWQDVTSQVNEGEGTKISRGLTQFGEVKPSSIEWTFEDPTGRWLPDNPMSPLYGKVGRSMPVRYTVDGNQRVVCEAAVFQPDRTEGFQPGPPQRGRQWVSFRADGVLARLSSWTDPLRSPMYQAISQWSTRVGHWPLEDGREALQLTNTVTGGPPGVATGVQYADDDAPAGATTSVKLTAASGESKTSGTFLNASTTAGWQLVWSLKLAAIPAAEYQLMSWRTSNGYQWVLNAYATAYRCKVTDIDGTLLLDMPVGFVGTGEPNQWVTFRMKCTAAAGTVNAEFAWYVQGQTTPYGTNGLFAGSTGRLLTWSANGNPNMQDAHLSHVYGLTTGVDDVLGYSARRAFDGYVGETAGARFVRIMAQIGELSAVAGSVADTRPMGRQVAATVLEIFQEIVATDSCLIYDSRAQRGVELKTRVNMLRQTPITLTYPQHISAPFRETYDYVGVTNRVTASQRDGGEATASQDTGPMSVQPAPAGIGERKSGVDVNVADEITLADIAGWYLAQGTLTGPRFPTLTVDLDANPALTATINAAGMGQRITVTGYRQYDIDLLIIGVTETTRQHRRTVTFTCVPGLVHSTVGAYDDTNQRAASYATTLKAGVNSTAVSLTFTTPDPDDVWERILVPYDVVIAGERIRVTAMGAVTGSGPYEQVATVTRSINAVVKSLGAGEPIQVFNPARWG